MKAKRTDSEMLDFVETNQASVTFASSEPQARQFRCYVYPRHFASPDRRERSARCGFGSTARKAIIACMSPAGLKNTAF